MNTYNSLFYQIDSLNKLENANSISYENNEFLAPISI